MGVINGAQTLYSIPFLTRADISEMCRGIFYEITKDGHSSMERPTIDGDMNNIAITVGRGALSKSAASATYCERWEKCGITFVPVCDGDRPVCKQATNERRATREKNRIKVFHLQKEIRQLQNKIDEGNHSLEEITEIKKEKVTKEKAFRAKISQCQELLPHDFAWTLEKELDETGLHETNSAGGLVTAVMRAKFQADALIGGRILKNETLMVVSKDSDIPIIVGDTCIAIKDYTINGKMTIVSTSRTPDARKRLDIKDAAHPIFESV